MSTSQKHRKISYVEMTLQFEEEKSEALACVERVLSSGMWVSVGAAEDFEKEIAAYCGVDHAVALDSGTSALYLAMRALDIGPGDEVITPVNSHFGSTSSIVQVGAKPVFADVRTDQNIDPQSIRAAITGDTKAIMAVHLTGRIADMKAINDIAREHGLLVIEDAAQSIGSRYYGERSGGLGDIAAFSAHPLKLLNASGDAGFVTTNNGDAAERIGRLRNHGLHERNTALEWGHTARMDVIQAELLRMRLARLDNVIERRRNNADLYSSLLNKDNLHLPEFGDHEFSTFHMYVIQVERREELQDYLNSKGIEALVHYPKPLHVQPAAENLGYREGDFPVAEKQANQILSLPIHQFLSEDDIKYITEHVNHWCVKNR